MEHGMLQEETWASAFRNVSYLESNICVFVQTSCCDIVIVLCTSMLA